MSADTPLDRDALALPAGSRVSLRSAVVGEDGFRHKPGSVAVVERAQHPTYHLTTPSGRTLRVQRDEVALQRPSQRRRLVDTKLGFEALKGEVIYSAVVGSQAWGLAGRGSDEDIRGCFLLPFGAHSSLFRAPDEIRSRDGDSAFWEVEKLIVLGLRGDANTLETLWSPLRRVVTPLGARLVEERGIFTSQQILGSFGRYAQSQFKKIERARRRDEVIAELLDALDGGEGLTEAEALERLVSAGVAAKAQEARQELESASRSLKDLGALDAVGFEALAQAVAEGRRAALTPRPFRPKNAYNLLRLLHSCLHWIEVGEPLIRVEGDLKARLLGIKGGETPIEQTLAWAREISLAIDDAGVGRYLPPEPDYARADALLRAARRHGALAALLGGPRASVTATASALGPEPALSRTLCPVALPADVDVTSVQTFLESSPAPGLPAPLTLLWAGLTGAHAYGFPSPDSDLDVKAIHLWSAARLLGLEPPPTAADYLGDWRGREMDFTSHSLGQAISLLLAGNGNVLERLLGPYPVLTTPAGEALAALAQGSLSQRIHRHYRGFFKGMCREYKRESEGGTRRAKRLLYAYRVALTGAHALETGEIITDVRPLALERGFPRVRALIQIKQAGEASQVEEALARRCEGDLTRLEALLVTASRRSPLPIEPRNTLDLEDFLVTLRIGTLP